LKTRLYPADDWKLAFYGYQINPSLRGAVLLQSLDPPGSARIRVQLPDAPHVIFDPTDASWHPYGTVDPTPILAHLPPSDLARIETRLRRYSEERAARIASFHDAKPTVNP
jgi:hypothetical protein